MLGASPAKRLDIKYNLNCYWEQLFEQQPSSI